MPAETGHATTLGEPFRVANQTAKKRAPNKQLVAAQTRGELLYVEDDGIKAILMSAALGMRPQIKLQIATPGAPSPEVARGQRLDFLLLDMHLPDTNGIELLAALRKTDRLQSMPTIVMPAGARVHNIERSLGCGFVGYRTKPLDIDKTLTELDDWLGRGLPASGG